MQWFLLVVYWQNCHPSPQLILGGITPERKPVPVSTLDLLLTHTTLHPHFTSPTLRHLLTYFLSLELPALDISINGIVHLVIFGDWFLSLNLMFSRFSPDADISASFCCWQSFHCVNIPHFIYTFISWQVFGLFALLAFLWGVLLLETCVYKFLHRQCLFGYMPSSWTGVTILGHVVSTFSLLRSQHVF